MAVFETWLKADLQKPVRVQQLSGNLFSADNGGNLVGVEVMDGGEAATLSGGVTGYIIRADGETVVIVGSLSGNRASIVLPASAYAVVGQVSIVIKLGTTTLGACMAYVYRTTTDTIVDPGHVIPDISELLAKIADCETATTAANNAATAANTAATGAEKVNISQSKSGKTITITTTNRSNEQTSKTIVEPDASLTKSGSLLTLSVTDGDGTTTQTMTDPAGTVAPDFDTTVDYSAGDQVYYSGLMYTFIVDHPAGAWNSAHVQETTAVAEIAKFSGTKADIITEQDGVYASVKTLSDGADGQPIKSLVVGIEPVQTGSGDPSPSNVRPISGWTGMNITRAGKNLFDKTACTDGSFINEDGTIGSSDSFCITDYMPVVAGGKISYKGLTYRGTSPRSAFYDENKAFLSSFTQQISGSYTRDVPAGAKWVRFSVSNQSTHQNKNTFMMVSGSEIGEYEAFTKGTYAVDLEIEAGTVYSGTLEVYGDGTGLLTVDRVGFTLDEITEFYGTTSQGSYKYTRPVVDSSLLKESNSITTQAEALKSVKQSATKSAYSCYVDKPSNGTESIYVICDTDTTVEYYNANIAGSKIIAKLKTPVEYTLTSAQVGQITTLLGTNNIWSDSGDIVSIEYAADTKLYVDRKAAETQKLIELIITANREDAMKATKAYSSGDLLIVNGTLYKATASIANGATITVGTNVTATTVTNELALLA